MHDMTVHRAGSLHETAALLSRARRLLAYGGLDGVVSRPLLFGEDGVYPQFAVAARGYEITDSMGRSLIDWSNGWGPVLLGYRHPAVEEAIRAQLAAGPTLSLMHPLEVEVAAALTEFIPSAEMVAFGKNGSDVVTGAVRVARAVTNRDLVLQHGFHGFHDWWLCQDPNVHGILPALKRAVRSFPYDDLGALEVLLRRHRRRVAAVVMEPTSLRLPSPGYLEGVRELTHRYGALLVFDELVTAFRLSRGGAQELFGVTPDLTCIGKALGNGMPIAGLVGKREYMQYLPSTGYGMTFRGETLSLAAAKAVLGVLEREDVCSHIEGVGRRVRDAFQPLCARHGVRCELSGHPSRMSFVFHACGRLSWEQMRTLFLRECLERGLVTSGTLLPSYAMDDRGIERSLEVFDQALAAVAAAARDGEQDLGRPPGGSPWGPRPLTASGFLDWIREESAGLRLSGWLLLDAGPAERVEIRTLNGDCVQALQVSRPDLLDAFPGRPEAADAGFQAFLPRSLLSASKEHEFVLHFTRRGHTLFRCHVVRQALLPVDGSEGPYWLGDGVLYI